MTEELKINLDRSLTSLRIISIVAGSLIAIGLFCAKIDDRMDRLELQQSRFEGVIEERTRNMSVNINRIYDILKEWSPDGNETSSAKIEEKSSAKI